MQMRAAAEKAIRLDPLLAEAHDALGMVYARDAQWEQSEKSFRRAIELDPSNSLAYSDLTSIYCCRSAESRKASTRCGLRRRPIRSHPRYSPRLAGRCFRPAAMRKRPAIARRQRTPGVWAGRDWVRGGLTRQSRFSPQANTQYLGYAYGRAGRREEAEKLAAAAAPNAFTQALTFAGLGDKDRTLEALDRMASLGAVRVGRALNSPEFALLRGDPRVKALRKKVGLPE